MSKRNETSDIIIIGAGISGLASAVLLCEAGRTVRILEAQPQAGGRIRSVADQNGAFLADLGPTWIWPAYQPVISKWVAKLGVSTFPQYDEGKAILDYGPGENAKAAFVPGQEGNHRVVGGSKALIDSLLERLPSDIVRTNTIVSSVNTENDQILIATNTGDLFSANHLIVAVPPRIAIGTIDWQPALPHQLANALEETPTWMAPHAKVAILFEQPFWRDQGLSGRLMSRSGPIVEAHDHCSADGQVSALWGFIGWSHQQRVELGQDLHRHVRAQLKRCFGDDSPDPKSIHIEDWALDPFVASPADLEGPMHHPQIRPDDLRQSFFNQRVFFAGAETAERSPGLIEGAFDSAERIANLVLSKDTSGHAVAD